MPIDDAPQPDALTGKRIVVTRAAAQAGPLTRALQARGATVIACPTIVIEPPAIWAELDRALASLSNYDWLFFTSANAVDSFRLRFVALGLPANALAHLRIGVIGNQTAAHARQADWTVDFMPTQFTAQAFAREFAQHYGQQTWRILMPASELATAELPTTLAAHGMKVETVTAYRNALPDLTPAEVVARFHEPLADYAVFTSSSTVQHLARLIAPLALPELLNGIAVACLGPVTAATLAEYGVNVNKQPAETTVQALVECL